MTLDEFDKQITEDGWALLEGVVPERMVWEMCEDLDFAYAACRRAQRAAGIEDATDGTVHHLPAVRGRSFLRFLESNPAAPYVSRFFGDKPYVLQSMGGQFNFPDATNYAAVVHRDVRSFWLDRVMLNTIVCLDDYRKDNGATWILPRSQVYSGRPSDETFDAKAMQAEAPAGSIILFDSRLWHKAGVNQGKAPRRIVTPLFARASYKAEFDYCRSLGWDRVSEMSEPIKQVLGYYARTPSTLDEYYRPKESRFYQGSQG